MLIFMFCVYVAMSGLNLHSIMIKDKVVVQIKCNLFKWIVTCRFCYFLFGVAGM